VVGGGVVLAVASFAAIELAKPNPAPLVVVQGAEQKPTTATSGVSGTNPLAGFKHPVANLAAVAIGGSDRDHPDSPIVDVVTPAGAVKLVESRLDAVAAQLWDHPGVDVCKVTLQSPDPRQTPTVVPPGADGAMPAGTPLFDCSTPTTSTSVKAG
jgi:hypothetical protein